jgi:hypothetical protein
MAWQKQSGAKIDSLATDGLSGVSNSLAYRVHEIEKHFHSNEHWVGKAASQTATDWAIAYTLTPFTAISGNGVFGADANDEALVIGTADTPIASGMVRFDVHRILVVELSVDTPYYFRLVYGSGTMADAITAGQESCFMVQNTVTGSKAGGFPCDVMMPRATCGTTKIWMQVACATDNATATFFVGVHEYAG